MNRLSSLRFTLGLFVLIALMACEQPPPREGDYSIMNTVDPRPITESFPALVAYLEEHHPDVAASLNPPATEAQIHQLETVIGQRLPDDVRQLYRMANGQSSGEYALFPDGYQFMPLEDIGPTWVMMKGIYDTQREASWETDTPQGAIKDRWWHPAWIPFAYMISGDHYCIDLDPAPTGTEGQIIEFIHDDQWRTHLGRSMKDYIGTYEQGLRAGRYVYHPDWKGFARKDEG